MLPITAFYAGLAGLWLIFLAGSVIRLRNIRRVSLGDGGDDDLAHARAAHRIVAEPLPVGLILLAPSEGLGAIGFPAAGLVIHSLADMM